MTTDPVRLEIAGGTALLCLDAPPVNALGAAMRRAVWEAMDRAEASEADVIAIHGAGRMLTAGADIKEFGKPPREPSLPDLCTRIERSETPVVAVIHGTTLGGGLEIALGAHARVALPASAVGLPEVTIGVIPGAGGTQRVPRLIGVARALDVIVSGRRIGAEEAMEMGLIDRIEAGEPREVALRAAGMVRDGSLATRRTGEQPVARDDAALKAAVRGIEAKTPHLFAPLKAVEAVALSLGPLDEGIAGERVRFRECIDSLQRAGLIHAFFAERAVTKIPEADATPREVGHVGVIGGGTMGSGIATAALLAGLDVTLVERDADALARGRATVERNLAGAIKRGKLTETARDAMLADALTATTAFDGLGAADLIVEAVFEDMAVKKDIFRRLDAVAKAGAVLATNTSYLDVDEIAAETGRPEDVIGLHFFSPAHVMRLLEVVVAERTAPEVVATGFALAKRMGKVAVRSGVCDGFIGNRILSHYRKAVDHMMLDGASPEQIDRAIEGFGFAMGPFAVSDLAGLDIGWATRKRLAPTRDPAERYVAVADRICEQGRFGRKTGRGFYLYPEGGGREPDPEIAAIVDAERRAAGIEPRAFTDDEIAARFVTAMIAEGARVLEDGIARRPVDIDAVFLFGYGFPRFRGGPMHHADTVGAAELVARIERYAEDDPRYWRVPPLLARMARDGTTFAQMNEA